MNSTLKHTQATVFLLFDMFFTILQNGKMLFIILSTIFLRFVPFYSWSVFTFVMSCKYDVSFFKIDPGYME